MLYQSLNNLVAKTDLQLTETQLHQLVSYTELLAKWNKAYNLTSIRDPQQMLIKHIMDSLMVGSVLQGKKLIDVGTGPGLPGIPLAILLPEKQFVLLDSLGKRITFLRQVVHSLQLDNVELIQSRVEQYQPDSVFDGVLSRAFASLQDMVSWCAHLVDQNGRFYALKGVDPQDEIAQMPDAFTVLAKYPIVVPELNAERHVIELKKSE